MDTQILSATLAKYASFQKTIIDAEKNELAKQALVSFYNGISKIKISKKYYAHHFHYSYLINLFLAKQAMDNKNYCLVCNNIGSLIQWEDIAQGRILMALRELLAVLV